MLHASLELALVPAVVEPSGARREERAARVAGPGWFDSSWELQRGLEVMEGWPGDQRLHGWIEDFLRPQRMSVRTASPSDSTAIA